LYLHVVLIFIVLACMSSDSLDIYCTYMNFIILVVILVFYLYIVLVAVKYFLIEVIQILIAYFYLLN